MTSWTARTRLTWTAVVLAGLFSLLAGAWRAGAWPALPPSQWLVLALGSAATLLLALRPVELAPDRKVTLAGAGALALALLFPALVAGIAGAAAAALSQAIARRPWYVAAFNAAQRALSVVGAAAASAAAAGAIPAPGSGVLLACIVYFVLNTGSVAAMSAARRGQSWPHTWWEIVRTDGPADAALLAIGGIVVVLAQTVPAAVLLLVPLLALVWRLLVAGAEVRRLNARLEASLASQRRFVADAAHELRTPVASLRAQVDALYHGLAPRAAEVTSPPPDAPLEMDEAVDSMRASATRLSALLADLLTLARADEGAPLERQPVELEDVLVDAYRVARPLFGTRVALELSLDEATAAAAIVMGDRERLRQLLLNLLTNAARYTPPGGQVALRCALDDSWATITVSDTGAGIASEDLPHVFDRFYRADPSRTRPVANGGGQPPDDLPAVGRPADGGRSDVPAAALSGAGLGLAIVKWIAEAHGGSAAVTSRVGAGSTFAVRLPLAARNAAVARVTAPPSALRQ